MSTKEGKPLVKARTTTRAKKTATKKAAAKKTASKKAVAKKISPKKEQVTKAPTKKAVKKTVAKKTATKKTTVKKASAKKASNAKKSVTDSTPTKKEVALEKLTSKAKTKAVAPVEERRLLIPSPFRFPLDVDKLAVQTARFAGVFFVLVGALFTLWYANLSFWVSSNAVVGQTITGTATDVVTTTKTFTDHTQVFDVNGGQELSSTVDIKINLEGEPQQVYFVAKNLDTGTKTALLPMDQQGPLEWRMSLDTTELEDGKYQFQAQVKYLATNGDFYTITVTDNQTRSILNDVVDVVAAQTTVTTVTSQNSGSDNTSTSGTGSQTVTEDVTTTEAVAGGLSGEIITPAVPLVGETFVTVMADNAERVKVSMSSQSDAGVVFVDYADQIETNKWTIKIDTTKFSDGQYDLVAVLVSGQDQFTTQTSAVSIKNQQTDVVADTTVDSVAKSATINELVEPEITLNILGSTPLSGNATVNVKVASANYVELYAKAVNSGTQRYLGVTRSVNADQWSYTWNTINIPNGEYRVVAKVVSAYGVFLSESDKVKVYNEIVTVTTEEELQKYETFEEIAKETGVVTTFTEAADINSGSPEEQLDELVASADEKDVETEVVDNYDAIVLNYQVDLDAAFKTYTTALRSGNENEINAAQARIDALVDEMHEVSSSEETQVKIASYAESKVIRALERIKASVERTNAIIAERTATEANTDSDQDGISDFDEVAIYNTDPLVADSDGDGFIDGAEILSGYDPVDPSPEAAVAYESPREVGVVREDILAVHTITTEDFGDGGEDRLSAVITGKAFPNSFVTLYIFSTPVVVTVKTEADGSWVYRFDKELEDGEHQIYVGVTDNAGKIVAKSNPFTFVKEAQAYTAVDAPVTGAIISNDDSGFLSTQNILYMVASIAVVAIGLVLIILGLHLEARPRPKVTELKSSSAT